MSRSPEVKEVKICGQYNSSQEIIVIEDGTCRMSTICDPTQKTLIAMVAYMQVSDPKNARIL